MFSKTTIKLMIIVGLACFFLPFVTVSCSGQSVTASGVELMTGMSLEDESSSEDNDPPNYYLIIAFGFGIAGIVFAHRSNSDNKKMLGAAGCGAGGILFLYLFRTSFIGFYKLSEYENYITVEFRVGWILSLLAFCCSTICAFIAQNSYGHSTNVTYYTNNNYYSGSDQQSPDLSSKANDDGRSKPDNTPLKREDNPVIMPTDIPVESADGSIDKRVHVSEFPYVAISYTTDGEDKRIVIDDFPCKIGRDSTLCKVPIHDTKTSRVHAEIFVKDGSVYIIDDGSTNGTKVNGKLISDAVELLSGDEVIIGETTLEVEISIRYN